LTSQRSYRRTNSGLLSRSHRRAGSGRARRDRCRPGRIGGPRSRGPGSPSRGTTRGRWGGGRRSGRCCAAWRASSIPASSRRPPGLYASTSVVRLTTWAGLGRRASSSSFTPGRTVRDGGFGGPGAMGVPSLERSRRHGPPRRPRRHRRDGLRHACRLAAATDHGLRPTGRHLDRAALGGDDLVRRTWPADPGYGGTLRGKPPPERVRAGRSCAVTSPFSGGG
jgi:hypothetical protein